MGVFRNRRNRYQPQHAEEVAPLEPAPSWFETVFSEVTDVNVTIPGDTASWSESAAPEPADAELVEAELVEAEFIEAALVDTGPVDVSQAGSTAAQPEPASSAQTGSAQMEESRSPESSGEMSSELTSPTTTSSQPGEATFTTRFEGAFMSSIDTVLSELAQIEGATGAAIVDAESGLALGTKGQPDFSLELAAAGNSEVVRAKLRTMSTLGITDTIDDILITLSNQYHLIRIIKGAGSSNLFAYVVLQRDRANLALARHRLAAAVGALTI